MIKKLIIILIFIASIAFAHEDDLYHYDIESECNECDPDLWENKDALPYGMTLDEYGFFYYEDIQRQLENGGRDYERDSFQPYFYKRSYD